MEKSTLFFLKTFNDIDHMSPIIWKVLEKGDKAIIIFTEDYEYEKDYRISYLQKKYNLLIYKFPIAYKRSYFFKIIREFYYNRNYCTRFLKRMNITACVFEWGELHIRGIEGHFFYAARKMGITTFCLPHGLSIYLGIFNNKQIQKKYDKTGKLPDLSPRNVFDFYIYQSEFHLKNNLKMGHDPKKTFAWGSSRFFPQWAKINLKICPVFKPKKEDKEKIKIVFMLPHWDYNMDKEKSLDLIELLISKEWIYLIIKDHTRGDGGLPNDLRKKYNSLHNVEASISAHSPTLIEWSDILISVSSISIEGLLQNKQLIYPFYLHTNRTIFDETLACHLANNNHDVLKLIEKFGKGELDVIPEKRKRKLYREVIYGGKEDFDVLDLYYNKISGNK